MKTIPFTFRNILLSIGLFCMMAGIFGLSFIWSIDHRSADSLSSYCRIDFQSSHNEQGYLEGAVLTLWDWRYDSARMKPDAILYADGDAWEMKAAVKQSPAGTDKDHPWQKENKLFVELPRASLPAIKKRTVSASAFIMTMGKPSICRSTPPIWNTGSVSSTDGPKTPGFLPRLRPYDHSA